MEDETTPPLSVAIPGLLRTTVRKALLEFLSESPEAIEVRDQTRKDLLVLTGPADSSIYIELGDTDLLKIARNIISSTAK